MTQMALKDKLSRIRRGAADEQVPSTAVVQASDAQRTATAISGGSRFGGLKNVRVGDHVDEVIPFDSMPTTRPTPKPAAEPAKTPGRFGAIARPQSERRVANLTSPVRVPESAVRAAPTRELPPIQWDDPKRPAGSSYSEDEWLAAEEDGAQIVFEMVKPDETALVAVPRANMNEVQALLYSRSLVVSEDVANVSQWPSHAQIVWRTPEFGSREVFSYRLVRAEAEILKNEWLQGSVLRNNLEVAYQDAKAAEKNRFGNIPSQR